jgi:hypothetical protein
MPSSIGSLVGGGGSQGSSTQQSNAGFSALPKELMDLFTKLGVNVEKYTNPDNAGVVDRFTPMGQTADEIEAFKRIRGGFAPTSESIQSDIAMLQNPFDQSVIDGINREAQGQGSILNQATTRAGQLGSNRGMLGANDIDLSRLQQIGQFKQSQFNNNLNNALTVLPNARQQDAQGMLGIGGFERGLDYQTRQAPITALQTGVGMIDPFVRGNSQSTSTEQNSSGGSGMLGGIGGLLKAGGYIYNAASGPAGLASLFPSDSRLKKNITLVGEDNGHKLYEFEYRDELGLPEGKFRGVMAQDVLKYAPEAVFEVDGHLAVNYEMLGLRMEAA